MRVNDDKIFSFAFFVCSFFGWTSPKGLLIHRTTSNFPFDNEMTLKCQHLHRLY